MIPAVGDHDDGAAADHQRADRSGPQPVGRAAGHVRQATASQSPRIDLAALDPKMQRWAAKRLGPQGARRQPDRRSSRPSATDRGEWLPAVPVDRRLSRTAMRRRSMPVPSTPARPTLAGWEIAAVLTSPVASAWVWHRQAGTGLSAGTIRLGPVLLGELPWPVGDLDAAVRGAPGGRRAGRAERRCSTPTASSRHADRDALVQLVADGGRTDRVTGRAPRLTERIRSGQPGDPAIIQSSTSPISLDDVHALRQRSHAPVGGVGDRADDRRRHQCAGERQQTERAMRSPRGVREADRQRGTERTEVAGQVGVGAGRLAEHERRDALHEHHDRHPRQSGPHPVRPAEPRRARSGDDALRRGRARARPIGHGSMRSSAREPFGERATVDAGRQMRVGGGRSRRRSLRRRGGRTAHRRTRVTFHAAQGRREWGFGSRPATLTPDGSPDPAAHRSARTAIDGRSNDSSRRRRPTCGGSAATSAIVDDADDLAQETYERAIGSIHRYRADGSARGWLLTIARRTCVDHTRRAVRRRRLNRQAIHEAGADRRDGALIAADPSGRVDLESLLERLDDDRRAAFVLTQVLGLHYDEAAEVLGCPVGTVRSRVSRARGDLVAMVGVASMDAVASTDADGSGTSRRRRAT